MTQVAAQERTSPVRPKAKKTALSLSDRYLAGYLSDLFESDHSGVESEGLHFYIKKGIVTVYGTLFNAKDHERILRLLGNAMGIRAIVDRMQVIEDIYQEELGAGLAMMLTDTYEPMHFLPA